MRAAADVQRAAVASAGDATGHQVEELSRDADHELQLPRRRPGVDTDLVGQPQPLGLAGPEPGSRPAESAAGTQYLVDGRREYVQSLGQEPSSMTSGGNRRMTLP